MTTVYDELSIAKKMDKTRSFPVKYTRYDVLLYAKYLRYLAALDIGIDYTTITVEDMETFDSEVEEKLIDFCKEADRYFNYNIDFQDIDDSVRMSRKYKLRLPEPVKITQKEWDSIMTIENDNYRRFLFVMLVDAKYNRYHAIKIPSKNDKIDFAISENTVFKVRMEEKEIIKAGSIKYGSEREEFLSLNTLYKAGLFYITEDKYRSWCIPFVDISNENVLIEISDYDHIDLYYDKLIGNGKAGECAICGKLFKQSKTKPGKYCNKHRGYQKRESEIIKVCINCGKQFQASKKSKRDICDDCYKEDRKKQKRIAKMKKMDGRQES